MYRKSKSWFLNLSINKKLSLILIPTLLLLIVAIGFSVYAVASEILNKKIEEQALETAAQISNNFDRKIEIAENKMTQLMNDPTVQEELKDDVAIAQQDRDNYYSNFRKIRRVLIQVYSSTMIDDIEIYADNGDHYYISVTNKKKTVENELQYLDEVKRNNGGRLVFFDDKDHGNIQILQQIKDELTGRQIGILRIALKKDYFGRSVETGLVSTKGATGLYAGDQVIFLNNETDVASGDIHASLKLGDYQIPGFFTIKYDSAETNWTTYVLLSNNELFAEINRLKYVLIAISILVYFIALLFINRVSQTIVGPIENITAGLKDFVSGDFSVRLPENRSDELGTMSSTFNYAVGKIEELIDEVSNMKKLEKELQYKTLQAQINPHFLYNTLDTIYWMGIDAEEEEISQMILSLSNLMRNAIDNKQEMMTIQQELKIVQNYLYIQQIRHKDKLSVDISVDPELVALSLPKLSLQPIIENAINHGLSDLEEDWQIAISLKRVKERILLSISDNGVGISEKRLQAIRDDLEDKRPLYDDVDHIGLKAVHKRLRFIYGEGYGLELKSVIGKGTIVTLVLPERGVADV